MMPWHYRLVFGAVLSLALGPQPNAVNACPFCVAKSETISARVAKAELAAIVRMEVPAAGRPRRWRVERMLKAPKAFAGAVTLEIDKPLAAAGESTSQRKLLLARIARGRVVPFRLLLVPSDRFIEYVAAAVATKKSSDPLRWSFFVERMLQSDPEISEDAFNELSLASYNDLRWTQPHLLPGRLMAAVDDEATPADRVGLLGLLLGIAGRTEDAGFLVRRIDAGTPRIAMGLDGLLGGLFLLDPQRAAIRSIELLCGPGSNAAQRRAALRALQFALAETTRVDKAALLQQMRPAVLRGEVGDLVLDELRYRRVWSAWAEAEQLLERDSKSGQAPRGSAVRFVLECPLAEAKNAVAAMEIRNPQALIDARHALRFERQLRDEWLRKSLGTPK